MILSIAVVMKDLFEYKLTSLFFGLLRGCDITFAGHEIPNEIIEEISNSFWRYIFNFVFLYSSRGLIHH